MNYTIPLLLFFISCSQKSNFQNLKIENKIHYTVDKRYASMAIDTAQIVGSYWWDKEGKMIGGRGKNKVAPLNTLNPQLAYYLKELSPTYLRIGGSEADALFYNLEENLKRPKIYDSELTPKIWNNLQQLLKNSEADLFFTLNSGPSSWIENELDYANIENFLSYLSKTNTKNIQFELGNEIFAYWAIFGLDYKLSPEKYAKYYLHTKTLLQKYNLNPKLAGPASAYWPVIGEPLSFLFYKMEDLYPLLNKNFDRITWHYYPTQSSRCPVQLRKKQAHHFLNPVVLDEVNKWAEHHLELKDKHSPNAELWLGETGPAQCGGEPILSSSFLSTFWWLDQLGTLALNKHDVLIRQSFVGADYALLNDDFTPRPDYYGTWLWKRYMGNKVLKLNYSNNKQKLRLYAHCSNKKGNISILAINISKKPITINLPKAESYGLMAMTTPELTSQNITINNNAIVTLTDLKRVTPRPISQKVEFSPYSINFVSLKSPKNQVCH